jgi:hypothetical protein
MIRDYGGGEADSLAANWLALPSEGLRFQGSLVPVIATEIEVRPSGLLVPATKFGERLLRSASTWMTRSELLGRAAPIQHAIRIVSRHPTEEILAWIGSFMWEICPRGKHDLEAQQRFVEAHLEGEVRERALAAVAAGRAVLSQQPLMVLAKLALHHGRPMCRFGPPPTALDVEVFDAALTVAEHLGTGEADHMPLMYQMLRMLHFHTVSDTGPLLARFPLLREILYDVDNELAKAADEAFREAAGVDAEVVFQLTGGLMVGTHDAPSVGDQFFNNVRLSPEDLDRALSVLAADEEKLRAGLEEEIVGVGKLPDWPDWGFSLLRTFPVLRLSDGRHVVLHPAWMLERTAKHVYWRKVRNLYRNKQKQKGKRKKGEITIGSMDGLVGAVYERYAGLVLQDLAAAVPGDTGAIATEDDLRACWGAAQKVCDFALDLGEVILLVDVSTRELTEKAICGDEHQMEIDLARLIDRKAEQLSNAARLLVESQLPFPSRGRPIIPVIIAAFGFPWCEAAAQVIRERPPVVRLHELALVQPLQVWDLDSFEAFVGASEGEHHPGHLLAQRAIAGENDSALDQYLHRRGIRLRWPKRLDPYLSQTFKDVADLWGLNPGDLDEPWTEP